MSDAVKIFAFVARKPGFAEDEFHRYWRTQHGDVARKVTYYLRYVQSHRVEIPGAPALVSGHDGSAELWFASPQAARDVGDDPYYRDVVVPDEARFIALDRRCFRLITREEVIAGGDAGPRAVKLVQAIRRAPEVTREALQAGFPGDDALARRVGAVRHVVSRSLPETYGDTYVPYDGRGYAWLTDDPFDVVRELWWSDREALRDGVAAAPEAFEALLAPELADAARSSAFFAEEFLVTTSSSEERT